MRKKRIQELNSGKLEYGKMEIERDQYKKIVGEEFKAEDYLYFKEKSLRQGDFDYYQGRNQTIDLKIMTYFVKNIDKDTYKLRIDNLVYDIVYFDTDEEKKHIYWYLTRSKGGGN